MTGTFALLRRARRLALLLPSALALLLPERSQDEPGVEEPRSEPRGYPNRRRMLETVTAQPGILLNELRSRIDVGGGAFYHHLKQMEEEGLLAVRASEDGKRVFPAHLAPEEPDLPEPLQHPRARELARLLLDGPPRSTLELARQMGLMDRIVRRELDRLDEAGLLVCDIDPQDKRGRRYSASAKLKRLRKKLREQK